MLLNTMIGVTFAIPQESRAFITGRERRIPRADETIVIAHTGIGLAAADRAVRTLLAKHTPTAVIAAGFAGALDPRLHIGDAVVATNCSAPALVERCHELWRSDKSVFFGELVTTTQAVETADAKAQLAQGSNAIAVDMESSAIAAVCRAAAVPLLALRVISDTDRAPLPLPFSVSYDIAAQRPRPLAVAGHLLRHPSAIPPLVRFLHDLAFAREELARRLDDILPPIRTAIAETAGR